MIKDKVFLFNVDGTLTPPLKSMTTDFMYFFLSWCADKKFYLVGGNDSTEIRKQVPHSICSRAIGVFSSIGNVLEESKEDIIKSKIIYFGDKVFKNENDYEAYLNLIKNKDGVCQKVTGPEDTIKILLKEYS